MKNSPSTLQDFPYEASISAIKESLSFSDFDTFYHYLVDSLPQNSPVTRKRYASLVIRWFFPDRDLQGLLPMAWKVYQNEQILQELVRVSTLEVEPVIASFVTDNILPLEPGTDFPAEYARNYIAATYGGFKENSKKRLISTTRALGFLTGKGSDLTVAATLRPANALLILLHARMAPTPRIVRLNEILESPLWRYLGMRKANEVRDIFHDAVAAGLLARYSTVDELEQVTTCYSLEEYFSKQCYL